MDGDFKGDFTRDSFAFDPLRLRQFSRVLMQQGRVQLDADWNEQTDLLLYALRTFITDLVGRHWGTFDFDIVITPGDGRAGVAPSIKKNSFKIESRKDDSERVIPRDFSIGEGHYYVDGMLVENPSSIAYTDQEPAPGKVEDNQQYWVYLDVWERQITYLEDSDIREVALGENGPDTATRAEVVWQVKTSTVPPFPQDINSFGQDGENADNALLRIKLIEDSTQKLTDLFQPPFRGKLKARGKAPSDGDVDPCITPPDAQFRGDENQLYRVEIHTGGTQETATFKWSRENGSVVFPIVDLNLDSNTVTLGNLGRDSHLSLEPGDWVEIVDDDYILSVATLQGPGTTPPHGSVNPLLQVDKIEVDQTNPVNVLVTLKNTSGKPVRIGQDPKKHPLLRRWDQREGTGKKGGGPKLLKDGTIRIKEGTTENSWITLEDGVQSQFQPSGKTTDYSSKDNPAMTYRTGDYWLIPARTIIGDVLWPQENDPATGMPYPSGHPEALPPHGVEHHYALLAVITFGGNNLPPIDLRYMVPPLGKLAVFLDIGVFSQLVYSGRGR
jgi:hypothetical protein